MIPTITPEELAKLREVEQTRAAAIIGVKKIEHLGYDDGTLVADLESPQGCCPCHP